jgi:hypothetical protein
MNESFYLGFPVLVNTALSRPQTSLPGPRGPWTPLPKPRGPWTPLPKPRGPWTPLPKPQEPWTPLLEPGGPLTPFVPQGQDWTHAIPAGPWVSRRNPQLSLSFIIHWEKRGIAHKKYLVFLCCSCVSNIVSDS